MTNQTIIELLARREGWTDLAWFENRQAVLGIHETKSIRLNGILLPCEPPPYLESLDALQPVLATLSDEEWKLVASYAMPPADVSALPWANFRKGATIQPELLATCIAKAIEKKGEE